MNVACSLVLLVLVSSGTAWQDWNNGYQDRMDKFWDNFDQKMNNLDKKIEAAVKRSKVRTLSSKIVGDEYKVIIYLTGFNKDDIVVNAKKGNLVIQAIHNVPGESANSYLDVRSLPDFVDEKGSWSYGNNKLRIVFPLKKHESDDTGGSTLPYVNETSENKDPDENLMKGDSDNSDDGDKL